MCMWCALLLSLPVSAPLWVGLIHDRGVVTLWPLILAPVHPAAAGSDAE